MPSSPRPHLLSAVSFFFLLPSTFFLPVASAATSWAELSALPLPKADRTVSYGSAPAQTIDIRLPQSGIQAAHPVALLLHGGCWSNQYDSAYMGHWAEALRQAGWATFNIEYRRNGDPGGGWPGTFDDIKSATYYVLEHTSEFHLDPRHVIVIGHSAGGHLALLLAAQDPRITAVVGLAAITDLAAYQKEPTGCAQGAREFVTTYDPAADPMQQPLPAHARIMLFAGSEDSIVPPRYAQTYAARSELLNSSFLNLNSPQAAARLPKITVKIFPNAGHFDLVSPTSPFWPDLLRQVSALQSDPNM